jgi:hypothetical protein
MQTTRILKLSKEHSEIIFGKLFKETGFEPSTRSFGRGEQRLVLRPPVQNNIPLHRKGGLGKWACDNLSLHGQMDFLDALNVRTAFLDALNVQEKMHGHSVFVTNLTPCDGLTAFKVDYDNGESITTSMAEGTTWEAAYNYYVGKTFTYERPNGEEYHCKCVRITQIG